MKNKRLLLDLLRLGGPANDLNFQAGAFPGECTFSRASSATVFAPNRLGSELIVNGTFDDGTTSWSTSPSSDSLTVVSGQLNSTNISGSNGTYFGQFIALEKGKTYRFSYDIGAGSDPVRLYVTDVGLGSSGAFNTERYDSEGRVEVEWHSTYGSGVWVWFYGQTYGGTVKIDNISVREVIVGEAQDPVSRVLVGPDKPRIAYDPITKLCKGLQVEPYAVNYFPFSDTAISLVPALGATFTKKGSYIVVNATQESSYFYASFSGMPTGKIVMTVELQSDGTRDYFEWGPYAGAGGEWGNNADSTCVLEGPGRVTQINGSHWRVDGLSTTEWTRMSISRLAPTNGTLQPHFYFGAGSVGKQMKIRAFQAEAGEHATSYIPTVQGVSVSRSGDVSNLQTVGSIADNCFVAEYELSQPGTPSDYQYVLNGFGYQGFQCVARQPSVPYPAIYLTTDGDKVHYFDTATGVLNKVAFSLTPGKTKLNGSAPSHSTAYTAYPIVDNLRVEIGHASNNYFFHGFIQRIRRYRRVLSDAEMQYLTQPTHKTIDALGLKHDLRFDLRSVPAGVTFTRASAATMECPNRLGNFIAIESATPYNAGATDNGDGTFTLTGTGWMRTLFPLARLKSGAAYKITFEITAISGTARIDFCDLDDFSVSSVGTYTFTSGRSTFDTSYRFIDAVLDAGTSVTIRTPQLQEIILHEFGDPISMVKVPVDTPTFKYDRDSGECLGIVVEPQRTNGVTSSQRPDDNTYWTYSYNPCTVSVDSNGGTKITASVDGVINSRVNYGVLQANAGQTYVVQAEFRKGSVSRVALADGGDSPWHTIVIDIDTKEVLSETNTVESGVEETADPNWVRAWFSAVATNNHYVWYTVAPTTLASTGGALPVASIGDSVYFRNPQHENGTKPTSYIPTGVSSATRAAPRLYKTVPFTTNGTLQADFTPRPIAGVDQDLFDLGSTSGFGYMMHVNPTADVRVYRGAGSASGVLTNLKRDEPMSLGISYSTARTAVQLRDGVLQTVTPGVLANVPTRLGIGMDNNGAYVGDVVIKRVRYFDRPLSDQELKVITTKE